MALAAAAVPEARFSVGDAQDLGPVDALGGPFAVVAAVQLLTHVANPLKLLREAARVAVPGGTLVMTVWGREHECDVRVFGEALAPWLPAPRRPPGPPALTDPNRLRKVAWLAGLAVAGIDAVTCTFDYPDDDAVLGPLLASGIGRAAVRLAGPDAVDKAVREALPALPDGGGRLPAAEPVPGAGGARAVAAPGSRSARKATLLTRGDMKVAFLHSGAPSRPRCVTIALPGGRAARRRARG